MTENAASHGGETSRGSILKLFGVVLVILGGLDSMLMWRGGFELSSLYVLMIAFGLFLYGLGAIRHRNRHLI